MDALERSLLAGEYVLGTLDAAARREIDAGNDAGLRREIEIWEERLAPLALKLAPVAPRPMVWLNLAHAIGTGGAAPAPQPYRWLRAWAALATAAVGRHFCHSSLPTSQFARWIAAVTVRVNSVRITVCERKLKMSPPSLTPNLVRSSSSAIHSEASSHSRRHS